MQTGEKAKARVRTKFSLFLYSFPFFFVLICMDSKNMMYSLLIMN